MATQCPVCLTVYVFEDEPEPFNVQECGGEGKCPARKAGERPSKEYVLCACNRQWLPDADVLVEGHGWDDCLPVRKSIPGVQSGRLGTVRSDGGVQKSKRNPSDLVKEAKLMVDNLFKQVREEESND